MSGRLTISGMFLVLALGASGARAAGAPATAPAPIDVTALGARPDDGADDGRAFQAAADACRQTPGSRLVIPPGRYDFFPGGNPRNRTTAIVLDECLDLTIEGGGAELVGHGLVRLFAVRRCEGLVIEDLTIDWDRLPFSQGKVLASSRTEFDVAVDAAYPVSGGEPVEAFGEYDTEARRPARRGLDIYRLVESTALVRPQVLRVKLSGSLPRPARVGGTVVLRHQVYSYNAFALDQCRDVTMRRVTVYACPGMGLSALGSRDVTLERVQVAIRPGTGRLMSATADATHFNTCAGTIAIRDCLFEGMGDDAVNVHGMFSVVKERVDERTIVAAPGRRWAYPPQPGDVLEVSKAETMLPVGEVKLESIDLGKGDEPARLVFAAPLPAGTGPGDLLANVSRVPALRLVNVTVRNNRARGFLIQTRDALVENCTFEGVSGAAIHVTCDSDYWFECLGTRGVTIRGSTFVGCNYGAAMGEGVIRVFAHLPKRQYAPAGVHRNLTIEKNRIAGTDNAALFIASTDGVVVRGNTFENVCQAPTGEAGRAAVYLRNVRNASIAKNRVEGLPAGAGALVVGPGGDRATIHAPADSGP